MGRSPHSSLHWRRLHSSQILGILGRVLPFIWLMVLRKRVNGMAKKTTQRPALRKRKAWPIATKRVVGAVSIRQPKPFYCELVVHRGDSRRASGDPFRLILLRIIPDPAVQNDIVPRGFDFDLA